MNLYATGTRHFAVHLRCSGCVKPSTRFIQVPRVEGAPSTVDELEESLEAMGLPFHCPLCDSNIGTVVAITLEEENDAA